MNDLYDDIPEWVLAGATEKKIASADDVAGDGGTASAANTASAADIEKIFSNLNSEQKKAVMHEGGPLLILAGAGSGKTRVITTKIAYLIATKKANAKNILAVTFTKKAANEMRNRAVLLEGQAQFSQIRTFHSFGSWILRIFSEEAGVSQNFTVYDETDSASLLKKAAPYLNREQAKIFPKKIALAKDFCLSFDSQEIFDIESDPDFPEAFRLYEERLRSTGNVDFGDLILLPVRLLQKNSRAKNYIQKRFRVVMIDEYQDTNAAQFEFLKALCEGDDGIYVCVVGDDDQSIYKFRGAKVENILTFDKTFPNTKIIRLEKNYRSTNQILRLANSVVSNNFSRLGKNLYSQKGEGKKPKLIFLEDQDEEARFCAQIIELSLTKGAVLKDWAILYRTNAQSRRFENEFLRRKIPYEVLGALKFYEHEEIKDLISALKFLVNPNDEISFLRIINKPPRGIGKKTQEKIIEEAQKSKKSEMANEAEIASDVDGKNEIDGAKIFVTKEASGEEIFATDVAGTFEATKTFIEDEAEILTANEAEIADGAKTLTADATQVPDANENNEKSDILFSLKKFSKNLSKKAQEGAKEFLDAFESAKKLLGSESANLSVLIETLAEKLGFLEHYKAVDRDTETHRTENIHELANAAASYTCSLLKNGVLDFLNDIELEKSIESENKSSDFVTLSTFHNTKGLEFERVIMSGMENGIFPRDANNEDDLQEERRLCYVAITRAKKTLYFTTCERRMLYGQTFFQSEPSKFLLEMDSEDIDILPEGRTLFPKIQSEQSEREKKFFLGGQVFHDEYGYGKIIEAFRSEDGDLVICVKFENGSTKKFFPKYNRDIIAQN